MCSTTGNPHHGPSYHAGTTGECTTELAQRVFQNRDSSHHMRKKDVDHAPRMPNGGVQLPRARRESLQKSGDLAREAVSCNAGLDGNARKAVSSYVLFVTNL